MSFDYLAEDRRFLTSAGLSLFWGSVCLREIVKNYEKHIIQQILLQNDYNKSKAARNLAITRKTLAQKIEKYHLSR